MTSLAPISMALHHQNHGQQSDPFSPSAIFSMGAIYDQKIKFLGWPRTILSPPQYHSQQE